MSTWRTLSLIFSVGLLSSCATDVVLKPAVNRFVSDGRNAALAVNKNYESLISETNRATAMLLAANPECGFNTRILARNQDIDDLLRSPRAKNVVVRIAQRDGLRAPPMPARTFCVTQFESEVLKAAYPDARTVSVPIQILHSSEFKPQYDTVQALTDYVAILADLADEPKLEARDRILAVAGKLRGVLTDLAPLAGVLGANSSKIEGVAAEKGVIQNYAGAVGNLVHTLELIAKQEQDVRALRAKLLDPDNPVREQMLWIGKEADRWNGQHRLIRQSMVLSTAQGMTTELPKMTFQQRTDVFSSFIKDVSAALPSRPASSPYGAMMVALADAHDDLQRIARQEYTRKERRAIANATLDRLAEVLKGISGVATLFI